MPCEQCETQIYIRKSEIGKRKYCSKECSNEHRTVYQRQLTRCENCNDFFISNEKPKSNSSGKFCKRECYNNFLIGKYKGLEISVDRNSYRKQWRKIRQRHIEKNDFCCQCGSTENLHVHHIDPYNTSKNNETWNLVTLCHKHHALHENRISSMIKYQKENVRKEMVFYVQAHMQDLWHVHQGRRLIANGNS